MALLLAESARLQRLGGNELLTPVDGNVLTQPWRRIRELYRPVAIVDSVLQDWSELDFRGKRQRLVGEELLKSVEHFLPRPQWAGIDGPVAGFTFARVPNA